MSKTYYFPLANRHEFISQVLPNDGYFKLFATEIGLANLKTAGELQYNFKAKGTLYIIGHGTFRSSLALRKPLQNREITPEALGAHLLGQPLAGMPDFITRLPRTPILSTKITKIKVFACFSGVAPSQQRLSLAQKLARYLRSHRIATPVYGYIGPTTYSKAKRRVYLPPFDQKASTHRTKFTAKSPGDKYVLSQEAQKNIRDKIPMCLWVEDPENVEEWQQT